ncbi:UNVERIFIED_ORG: transposase-like protein [Burkholderia sp. CF145]
MNTTAACVEPLVVGEDTASWQSHIAFAVGESCRRFIRFSLPEPGVVDPPIATRAVDKVLKRLHYPLDVMLTCVRWYVAYPLSLRNLEEMMAERGVSVDHSIVHRWAIKLLPALEPTFRRHKRAVGRSWRMDETYVKVNGEWKYLYRAVDKAGDTVDFLLRAKRDKVAARRYFEKAIDQNGVPETVTIDKSGANLAGLHAINAECETSIKIRQAKYLNNVVEQDHRAIKRRTRPMVRFKNFRCARTFLGGVEVMHMIKKRADGVSPQNRAARSRAVLRVVRISSTQDLASACLTSFLRQNPSGGPNCLIEGRLSRCMRSIDMDKPVVGGKAPPDTPFFK